MTAALTRPAPSTRPRRVALRAAPRREPPFDDELSPDTRPSPSDRRLPFARVHAPLAPVGWRPAAIGRSGLPDPVLWGRRLVVGMIETAGGRRPLPQLAALLSPSGANGLAADFDRAGERSRPHWLHRATVRTVRASEPAQGVAELCVVVDVGDRVRAIALRLEARHGRWVCTRIQLG